MDVSRPEGASQPGAGSGGGAGRGAEPWAEEPLPLGSAPASGKVLLLPENTGRRSLPGKGGPSIKLDLLLSPGRLRPCDHPDGGSSRCPWMESRAETGQLGEPRRGKPPPCAGGQAAAGRWARARGR